MMQVDVDKFEKQTLFGGHDAPASQRGNCYQMCLAAMLRVPSRRVPHFYGTDETTAVQNANIARFLARRGLWQFTFDYAPFMDWWEQDLVILPQGSLVILNGKSPRGHNHACIGVAKRKKIELLWDPHPSNEFFVGPPSSIELVSLLPRV